MGAVLFQHELWKGANYQLIGICSRSLNEANKNYTTPERECLAIVWATLTPRPYLQNTQFHFNTAESSLWWLPLTTDGTGRLLRCRLRLSESGFDVHNGKGINNLVGPCMSQVSTECERSVSIAEEVPCYALSEDDQQNMPEASD